MRRIDLIAGARPNFMKIAPIIDALNEARSRGSHLQYRLIHTGQHYDRMMSGEFFAQLGIPEPDLNLEAGSGTQAEQTAAIMIRYERVLQTDPSDLCLVVGDVNSTLACAIVARKLGVPVAHVEAGIRSGDWTMPEEINRVVTDSVANWFFTTSRQAGENLCRSGVKDEQIFFVGNTMIDTLLKQMPRLRPPQLWETVPLKPQNYFVLTLHRPANVDNQESLRSLLHEVASGSRNLPVVFPMHPRTKKQADKFRLAPSIHYTEPMGYLEFNFLVKHSKAVITDSGGITEEASVLGVPCMTLRNTTERPETVIWGTNELIGTDPSRLKPAFEKLFEGGWKSGGAPELWDGKTGTRIVEYLSGLLA